MRVSQNVHKWVPWFGLQNNDEFRVPWLGASFNPRFVFVPIVTPSILILVLGFDVKIQYVVGFGPFV